MSRSLKFSLIAAHGERTLAEGGVDWVQKSARFTIRRGDHAAAYEGLAAAHAKERLGNMQIECQKYAYEDGVDKPQIDPGSRTGSDHAAGAAK